MTVRDRRIPLSPSEGWLTLILVLVLCVTLALAIDDVALILGQGQFTDFLAPMAVLGVLCAFVGVKVGWSRWLTYLVGSLIAVLVVPLVVGSMLPPLKEAYGTLAEWYIATARSSMQAFIELVLHNAPNTTEYGHYMLALGLLVWGTSMFAGYAVFGHRRPLNAIVVVGLALLVNMSLAEGDQLPYLVVFSLVSLLLLVRYHVLDEQTEWLRRRIGDPASISGIYQRGGSIFIAVTVLSALLLTNIARSAPLEGTWDGMSGTFIDVSRSISKYLPAGGNTKGFGSDFDPRATAIRGKWTPNHGIEAVVAVPPDAPRDLYWRATSYDEYVGNGWQASDAVRSEQVASGQPLLGGTLDSQLLASTQGFRFTVQPMQNTGKTVLAPGTPTTLDKDADVTLIGPTGSVSAVERREGGPYTITTQLRLPGNKTGQLNGAALSAAGTDYPKEITDLYLQIPPDAMPAGGWAATLLKQFVADAPDPDNPYKFAEYLREQFVKLPRDGGLFTYQTDVSDLGVSACKDISTVECFAHYKRGFCQWYATTMAIFLRAQGIPARVVNGYLPGNRVQGQVTIRGDSLHMWVEVYFPSYGWVMFDPTGTVAVAGGLPAGPAGASVGALPLPSFAIPTSKLPKEPEGGINGSTRTGPPPIASFIAIGVLLAVIVAAVAFVVWQRGPRDGTTADHAYRTVTRLAARFGFGPRPNQTVYEYSGALGEVLPIARPELELVAAAKVESTYARALLGDERIRALRAAERKLRLDLLRLAFRRRERRRRR